MLSYKFLERLNRFERLKAEEKHKEKERMVRKMNKLVSGITRFNELKEPTVTSNVM